MPDGAILTHTWQERGLGRAPFRCIGVAVIPDPAMAASNPEGYRRALEDLPRGIALGTCRACGQSLMINCLIRDADGKRFAVGSDCVLKTGDARLVAKVEADRRRRAREQRQAKAAAMRAARAAEHQRRLQDERARNGGLTDAEAAESERQAAMARAVDRYSAENAWLIERLSAMSEGGFVADMVAKLKGGPLNEERFYPRAIDAMRDIYARSFGRRNSKAYSKAEDEFLARLTREAA